MLTSWKLMSITTGWVLSPHDLRSPSRTPGPRIAPVKRNTNPTAHGHCGDKPHLRDHRARRGSRLGDVQIAARHADPRTPMRYDRARTKLDRHPNYISAAYMASGT